MVAGLVVVLLCLGGLRGGHAQTSADSTSKVQASSVLNDQFVRTHGTRGLDALYNMRFEEAKHIFEEIDQRYPNHPIGPFLQGLNLWWTIMLDLTDRSHDDEFIAQMNTVIDRCDELLREDDEHFDAALFKAAAHAFLARLHSNRWNWWKTIRNGRRAIQYVQRVEDVAPERGDYVFGSGMYDYYTAVLPKEYSLARPILWLLPDGNKVRGLKLLRETATNGHYVQTEAAYFLAKIHYLYEDDYRKTNRWVQWLRKKYPDNPFFHTFEGRTYARWGRWDDAREVFRTVLKHADEGKTGYTVHMEEISRLYLARDRLYQDQYREALSHLAELEQLTSRDIEDTRYRMLGYLYQGMVYDALDQRDMAVNRYRKVLTFDDASGAHDRARKYLDEPYPG